MKTISTPIHSTRWHTNDSNNAPGIAGIASLSDSLPLPVIAVDASLNIIYMNPRGSRLFGIGIGKAEGRSYAEIVPEESNSRVAKHLLRALQQGLSSEISHTRDSRSLISPLQDSEGRIVGAIEVRTGAERAEKLMPEPAPSGTGVWVPVFIPNA